MSYNNPNHGEGSSNYVSFDQRMRDYHEYQTRLYQQNQQVDDMVDEYILDNPSILEPPTVEEPRKKRNYYDIKHEEGHARLFNDYFAANPVYPEDKFRQRFCMHKHLFLRIVEKLTSTVTYFKQRKDAAGRPCLSSLQKCTTAMRVLAYGSAADAIDEYLRMSDIVTKKCLKKIAKGVIKQFGEEYLRRPNARDLARLLHEGEIRGFPGMLGSVDCMHWQWKNCPTAWQGQYAGRSGKATIILEVVASYDLWIWHAFFGTPGSLNDINVLNRSHIFQDMFEGRAPKVSYVVNGKQYNMGYYLTDGIYPSWAAFVKSISNPVLRKLKLFASHQESVRKDVERAFGVLQARFAFIRKPCLIWDDRFMRQIIMACIIMHNMIVEDERHTYQNYDPAAFDEDNNIDDDQSLGSIRQTSILEYMANREAVQNSGGHETLKNDLIEHIWQKFGNNNS